jgi:hypothetical protein
VLLAEIEAAASGPTPATDLAATVARLEASNAKLWRLVQQLQWISVNSRLRTCRYYIAPVSPRSGFAPEAESFLCSSALACARFPRLTPAHSGKGGVVAQMKEETAMQFVIGAQRRPAPTAALIHLLTSAPRKLHDWPAIALAKPAIHLTLNRHELELAGPVAIEPNVGRTKHIDIVMFPQLHLDDAPQA